MTLCLCTWSSEAGSHFDPALSDWASVASQLPLRVPLSLTLTSWFCSLLPGIYPDPGESDSGFHGVLLPHKHLHSSHCQPLIYLFLGEGVYMPQQAGVGQRSVCGSQFSLPTIFFLGMELRLSGLVASSFSFVAMLLALM